MVVLLIDEISVEFVASIHFISDYNYQGRSAFLWILALDVNVWV